MSDSIHTTTDSDTEAEECLQVWGFHGEHVCFIEAGHDLFHECDCGEERDV